MIVALSKMGEKNIAIRYSELEPLVGAEKAKKMVKWLWIDCFSKLPLDKRIYKKIKATGLKTCLVSPELQGRQEDVEKYSKLIKKYGINFNAICTKLYNVDKWGRYK